MVTCFWRRSLRGCDLQLTLELNLSYQKVLRSSPNLVMCVLPTAPSDNHFQGHFEKAMCYWDHLDGIHDWNQLKPLYKFIRLWQEGTEILILQLPKTSLMYKFPCLLNCHIPIWSGMPLSSVSLCPPYKRTRFRFHPGSSWGLEPTLVQWDSSNFLS